jgi:dTDP-glucose 4,6-dehydratase
LFKTLDKTFFPKVNQPIMPQFRRHILITGGAGFIGSHLVRHFVQKYPDTLVVNLDALTYAGNLENLNDLDTAPNYSFQKGDICDLDLLRRLFSQYNFDGVLHCAAESHVDRSIENPLTFIQTNVLGTGALLQVARENWQSDFSGKRFLHISTDEVFGSLGKEGYFTEETKYDPRSPYSASKAGSDHLVRAFYHTYGLPVIISNCSNTYGPYQFPEKLIPLFIRNILTRKPLPVYGKGDNIRDWLFVLDHVKALDLLFHDGQIGQTYAIGGHNEWKNIDLVNLLCDLMDQKTGQKPGYSRELITYVKDRQGHDHRYAIDASKVASTLGWQPSCTFEEGLSKTIDWYLSHGEWIERVCSGAYQQYYDRQYNQR